MLPVQSGLLLIGEVRRVFKSQDFTDKETGEVKEGKHKVQIEYEEVLSNQERRLVLQSLSVHDYQLYDALRGQVIAVPVGMIPNGKAVTLFVPRGVDPVLLEDLSAMSEAA